VTRALARQTRVIDKASTWTAWLRPLGAVCLVLIVMLSLWPGRWQQHTHVPGPIDHFVAYFGTAVILLLGRRDIRFRIFVIIGLSAFSALMEVLQNFSPGRDPQLIGFVASSAGASLGGVTAYLWRILRS
jgi:VanZ family protein